MKKTLYSEETYVQQQNLNPELKEIDPLVPFNWEMRQSRYSTYPTRHYLKEIDAPAGRDGMITLKLFRQAAVDVKITKENFTGILEKLSDDHSWSHDYVIALKEHFKNSIILDWHNIILNRDLDNKRHADWTRDEYKKYILEYEYEQIDKKRIGMIAKILETGCLNGLISVFDRERQEFSKYISYQGLGEVYGPLCGEGGVYFSYKQCQIAYMMQVVS